MRGDWNVSIRRACRVFLVDTSTCHYKSRRPGQAALERRIKEICQTRVRYGYRRVHVLLRREGWSLGQNNTRRNYRELGLQLRNKTPKRRVKAKLRADRRVATQPSCVCRRSWIRSRASRRLWSRASPSAARILSSCWKESGDKWDCRQRSGSTRVCLASIHDKPSELGNIVQPVFRARGFDDKGHQQIWHN